MTIKTILYDTADQNVFAHNAAEVGITTEATLIKRSLASNELYVATGRLQKDADLGADLNIYLEGGATHDLTTGYDVTSNDSGTFVSLNDPALRDGVTPIVPTSHFDISSGGTVRFKMTPDYSGTPSPSTQYIFSTGDSTLGTTLGLGSLISFYHDTSGNLRIRSQDGNGSTATSPLLTSWSPVAGTEYEFELNINTSANTLQLFIDGVAVNIAMPIYNQTGVVRDYFYFGAYYTPTQTNSSISVRDIQIFNTIQHTVGFASEVPRIVNIYPMASLIEPTEYSEAQEFISLDTEIEEYLNAVEEPITNGAEVKYVLKVENSRYFISGTALVPYVKYESDGSLRSPLNQCNTAAEWVADLALVNTLLTVGSKLTFQPVITSGSVGIGNLKMLNTELNYDFSALPMSCTHCVLYGFVKDNCEDITEGTIRVYTKKPIITQGNLTAFDTTVDIEIPNGYFEVPVVIPNLPTDNGDVYLYALNWTDADGKGWSKKGKLSIPNQTTVILGDAIV